MLKVLLKLSSASDPWIMDVLFLCVSEDALIIYVSRGLLSSLTDARHVLNTIAVENGHLGNKVIINTYAVIDGEWQLYQTSISLNTFAALPQISRAEMLCHTLCNPRFLGLTGMMP